MKKFFLCLLAVLMAVPALSAQINTYEDFKREIAAGNSQCPVDVSPIGYVTSIELDERQRILCFTAMVNNPMLSYVLVLQQKENMRQNLSLALCSSEMKMMVEPCVRFNVAYVLRFKWSTGEMIDFKYTPAELSRLYNTDIDDNEVSHAMIERMIASEAAQCPRVVESGITSECVYRFENNIYYEFSLDENLYPIDVFYENESKAREPMERYLRLPAMLTTVKHLVNCGYNVVLLYVGKTSGRTFEVTFTTEDLQKLIR